jgi:hypothetical protein
MNAILHFLLLLFTISFAFSQDKVTLEGEIDVIVIDYEKEGKAEYEFFIRDVKSKKTHKLKIKGKHSDLKDKLTSGDRVRIKGKKSQNSSSDEAFEVEINLDTTEDSIEFMGEQVQVSDKRRLLTILVNLEDISTSCTPTQAKDRIYPSAIKNNSGFFSHTSFMQQTFLGSTDTSQDVVGPIKIPHSSTSGCNFHTWASSALSILQESGFDFSKYRHRLFIVPAASSCSWAGVAHVGCGTACSAWVKNCANIRTIAHELGHNLGLGHAGTDLDNDGVIESVYGDWSDSQGTGTQNYRQFSAPNKIKAGYFRDFPEGIVDITRSGTYTLHSLNHFPQSLPSQSLQVLRIAKKDRPGEFYTISYRANDDAYEQLTTGWHSHGYVHSYTAHRDIAMNAKLLSGQTFVDLQRGIRVTRLDNNGLQAPTATFRVDFGCARSKPSVLVANSTVLVTPGGSALREVSVTNNDAACEDDRAIDLATTSSNGTITRSLSQTKLTLKSGETQKLSLSVSSSTSTAEGKYLARIVLSTPDEAQDILSNEISVVVDSSPPTIPTNIQASYNSKSKSVSVAWTASSDSLSSVASYQIYRDAGNGMVLLGTATGTSYSDASVSSGLTYKYAVGAVNGVNLVSALSSPISITVQDQVKGGGGSGGGTKGQKR